jgi:hypothetical protein
MAKLMPSRTARCTARTAGKQRNAETGMRLATIAYAPSCILDPASRHPKGTWGGARNRADRASLYLSRNAVTGMLEAAAFAERIGLAFNRHWTVHYEMAGIAEREGAAFVGRLLSVVRKHVRRKGSELAALWSRENGDNKGGHVHILLHTPADFTLKNCTRAWIKAAGGRPVRRVTKVRTIGRALTGGQSSAALHHANLDAVLAYLVKAASDETGRALGLPRYGEDGLIIGKRCGMTQNIGPSARRVMEIQACQRRCKPLSPDR